MLSLFARRMNRINFHRITLTKVIGEWNKEQKDTASLT